MLNHRSHKVGLNCWHLVWATKYRYKMMQKFGHKNLVVAAIRKAAYEHHISVHELEVMPDHVHLLAVLPSGMTDCEAFRILKGRSAYLIFKNQPKDRLRYPRGHFWSPGGCAVTVGQSDYNKTRQYIQNQYQAATA
jgi:putative transposase